MQNSPHTSAPAPGGWTAPPPARRVLAAHRHCTRLAGPARQQGAPGSRPPVARLPRQGGRLSCLPAPPTVPTAQPPPPAANHCSALQHGPQGAQLLAQVRLLAQRVVQAQAERGQGAVQLRRQRPQLVVVRAQALGTRGGGSGSVPTCVVDGVAMPGPSPMAASHPTPPCKAACRSAVSASMRSASGGAIGAGVHHLVQLLQLLHQIFIGHRLPTVAAAGAPATDLRAGQATAQQRRRRRHRHHRWVGQAVPGCGCGGSAQQPDSQGEHCAGGWAGGDCNKAENLTVAALFSTACVAVGASVFLVAAITALPLASPSRWQRPRRSGSSLTAVAGGHAPAQPSGGRPFHPAGAHCTAGQRNWAGAAGLGEPSLRRRRRRRERLRRWAAQTCPLATRGCWPACWTPTHLQYYIVRVDAPPGVANIAADSCPVTIESGPHHNLALALEALQHPKQRVRLGGLGSRGGGAAAWLRLPAGAPNVRAFACSPDRTPKNLVAYARVCRPRPLARPMCCPTLCSCPPPPLSMR